MAGQLTNASSLELSKANRENERGRAAAFSASQCNGINACLDRAGIPHVYEVAGPD